MYHIMSCHIADVYERADKLMIEPLVSSTGFVSQVLGLVFRVSTVSCRVDIINSSGIDLTS
jgi:hypothetical protein